MINLFDYFEKEFPIIVKSHKVVKHAVYIVVDADYVSLFMMKKLASFFQSEEIDVAINDDNNKYLSINIYEIDGSKYK